jgi:methyl-accepting chemotaxis protein
MDKKTDASTSEAAKLTLGIVSEKFEAMRNNLDALQDLNDAVIEQTEKEADAIYARVSVVIKTMVSISIIIAIFLGFILTRGITGPVDLGLDLARTIALGDLTKRLRLNQKDEIGNSAMPLTQWRMFFKGCRNSIRNSRR